jgi:hypothetical protein
MSTIRARLRELEIEEGSDYTFGKSDVDLIDTALRHYAEYLRSMSTDMRGMKHDELALTLYAKSNRAYELRDIIDMGFETVVHGVGD